MKIIFFGSSSPLSLLPLKKLIQSSHTICAVVINEEVSDKFNVISPGTIQSVAFENNIPVVQFDSDGERLANQLTGFAPDLIFVSCFAKRLLANVISVAKKGGVNLHPSLLPEFRGPNPLFWQYRQGVDYFGITLHQLSTGFDTGDIILQKIVKLVDGLSIDDATYVIAEEAESLILPALDSIEQGKTDVIKQEPALVSYQSFPTEKDFEVSIDWTAKRIFNFVNAYKSASVSFTCNVYGQTVRLISVKSFQAEPYPELAGESKALKKGVVYFACQEGFVECEIRTN